MDKKRPRHPAKGHSCQRPLKFQTECNTTLELSPLAYPQDAQNGPHNQFIGANHACCRIDCELKQPLPPGALLHLSIHNASGSLICRHAMQQVNPGTLSPTPPITEWEIHLPLLYATALQSGQWTYNIDLCIDGQAGLGEGSIDPVLLGIQPG